MRDHVSTMSEDRPSDVLGALPRTRPHRRSDKRATRPEKDKPTAVTPEAVDAVQAAVAAGDPPAAKAPAKANAPAPKAKAPAKAKVPPAAKKPKAPAAAKPADAARAKIAAPPAKPATSRRTEALGTAVQAAAELAEIGLTASARAIRRAVSRPPRP